MVKQTATWMVWIVGALFISASHAAVTEKSVNALLAASGFDEMVGEFPAMVKTGMVEAFKQQSDTAQSEVDNVVAALDRNIVPASIIADMRSELSTSLSEAEVSKLLAWYQSDLGKAFASAAAASGTDEAFSAMQQQAPQLMQRKQLVNQVTQIESELDLTKLTVDFFENVQLAVFAGIMSLLQPEAALNVNAMKEELVAVRNAAERSVQQMMVVSMVYAYKDFKPQDVDAYLTFLKTPAAKKFNQIATQSMFKSMQKSFRSWAEEIGADTDDV